MKDISELFKAACESPNRFFDNNVMPFRENLTFKESGDEIRITATDESGEEYKWIIFSGSSREGRYIEMLRSLIFSTINTIPIKAKNGETNNT